MENLDIFTSALPIKPYNIGAIRDNKESADMYNRSLVTKLQKDPQAKDDVKKEMEKLISLGFIKKPEGFAQRSSRWN